MEQVFWNEGRDDNTEGCIEFPKLKELRLFHLPNLTAFCQGLQNVIVKFPNLDSKDVSLCYLKSISICGCHNLRYLFSVSAARRCLLQLEDFQIEVCDSMEQVFWNEGKDNTDGCFEFPKLKKLILKNLPNLTAFCQGLGNIIDKFPNLDSKDVSLRNLKSISICGCHNLRYLFSLSAARRCLLQLEYVEIEVCDSMEQVLWNEGRDNTDGCVEFPKLKKLTLNNLPNLRAFCQGLENIIDKFPNLDSKDVSLCNLKSISIFRCHNIRYLLSVSARRCFLQLEDIEIQFCDSMEQVFWNEGRDDNTDGCIEFPKLKELKLFHLPNLIAFCQGLQNVIVKFPNLDSKDVSLCNLKSISIFGCHNIRYLFSVSARRCLLQLEDLEIQVCDSMEQVFWNEGRDDNTDNTDGCIEFPKLNKLRLFHLPNLTAFCQGLQNIIVKFPKLDSKDVSLCNLKSISIFRCHNIRYLFSVSARRCLLQLEVLEIQFCDSMEQVFWNEGRDDNTDDFIEFPKLKELRLKNLPNLTAFCQGLQNIIFKFPNLDSKDVSFRNLKSIYIRGCHNLRYVFSVSGARRCLLQLEVLNIKNCVAMEQVFWEEGTDDITYGCIEFSKLKELTLENLPNLTAFCQGLENIIIKFPNLTVMKIGGLPKLISLSPLNSETVCRHDQNTCFHFVCNPKVEMSILKNLTLSMFKDNIKNIWCHQIPNNFFNNLERLKIHYMNGIRSLMSTSIAKNLVSLKYLHISDCEEMVEVIEIDDDNDKQVVDIICLFPNLKSLDIRHMPKLRRFWQWNHALELPLLKEMNIHDCTVMKTFTLGSINTPNIMMIKVNDKQKYDEKDLNDVIRNIWTECQDKFKVEEDGDGDEKAKMITILRM